MTRIFVISDTHFGHTNAWAKFKLADGCTPMRPFTSTEEMDETMVARWNETVRPQDHVYHLGDVAIAKRSLSVVKRLNGHKRLVRGNHDIFKTREYLEVGFDEIYGVRVFVPNQQQGIPGAILTHIPIHPASLQRWGINVHGHTHANFVTKHGNEDSTAVKQREADRDLRYVCVSVEQTNYAPILLDDILRANKKNVTL